MARFIVTTVRNKYEKVGNKRYTKKVTTNYEINVKFIGTEAQLGYGYAHTISHHDVTDSFSAIRHEVYDLHHVVHPIEGDIWYHAKSGRTFTIGKKTGFVNYIAPILENGVQVGTVKFEEYYKD